MSHTYLLDLYDLIDQRLENASQKIRTGAPDDAETRFQQGRYDILSEFKQFLAERYNRKLPRRIRNKFAG